MAREITHDKTLDMVEVVLSGVNTGEELRDNAEFFETVCINRGWAVQRFTDREQAIRWLSE